ncbi:MAG: ribosome maturation factor RimP [Gammaproteobacteria bacterium]|nr:ribosome maturation factor RimP [Gammaproteobacteria bacterium]
MNRIQDSLVGLLGKSVTGMGYELVGVEFSSRGSAGALLRIYIDHPEGITVDDCAEVSHQVSGVLDVEDPIPGEYQLEVSSPGLDRPLFDREHYERFSGSPVRIKLQVKLEGRRRFEGLLKGVDGDEVLLEMEGELFRLPLSQIEKARLMPEF